VIKYIIPAIIIFLIVLFWEKISIFIKKKFNIKFNYLVVISLALTLVIIILLLTY